MIDRHDMALLPRSLEIGFGPFIPQNTVQQFSASSTWKENIESVLKWKKEHLYIKLQTYVHV